MTEPKTYALEAPGAVLHYDVRANDDSAQPVLLIIGSPDGRLRIRRAGGALRGPNGRDLRSPRGRAQQKDRRRP